MKCSKCGNEFNGKFCTNCGSPAPTNPVCPTCGEEVKGKFCTKCGAPAPQADAVTVPATEPAQIPTVETTPVQTEATQNAESMQYNPAQNEPAQPMQNAYQQYDSNPEPVQYGQTQPAYDQQFTNQPNDRFTGQQFTNQPNDQFVGQQFTNQPVKSVPNGKKPMSGGKVVALVVGIVAALVIIIGVIVGILMFKFIGAVEDEVSKFEESSKISIHIDDDEETTEEVTEEETTEDSLVTNDIEYEEKFDSKSGLYYSEIDSESVEITGYEGDYSFTGETLEVKIPSEIDGKAVVNISFLGVWDFYEQDVHIKVTIPGSIKSLSSYSLSFNDDIDEVVIEDGVETLESDAFIGCDDLVKVTVPESVTMMDDCGLGLDVEDDDYSKNKTIDGFVMYGKKGSAAESYCKENGLKFSEIKK